MDNQEKNVVIRKNDSADANEVLILGIISLALMLFAYTFSAIAAIPAIALSSIAIRKANALKAGGGPFAAKPRVGYILAKVAKPLSVIQCILWALALLICLALIACYGYIILRVVGSVDYTQLYDSILAAL